MQEAIAVAVIRRRIRSFADSLQAAAIQGRVPYQELLHAASTSLAAWSATRSARSMNFVHSGNPATALLEDRQHATQQPAVTTSHLVLIPSYNTGARLFPTVAAIRRQEWPVWVVIDGSTDGTGEKLACMATNDPDLRVFTLPRNQGKGAAILHGLRLAHAQGFTHVVTMDADGQHSADHVGLLIALSREHPEAMVLGVPVFELECARGSASSATESRTSGRTWRPCGLESAIRCLAFASIRLRRCWRYLRKHAGCGGSILSRKPPSACPGGAFRVINLADAGPLLPPRGRRRVAFQIRARQHSVVFHVRAAVRRTAAAPAWALGPARQNIPPLIEIICAEI